MSTPDLSPLIGKINVYNVLAACGAGLSYGIPPDTIARGIATPAPLHVLMARRLAAAGVHMLIEKPLDGLGDSCNHVADARRLRQEAALAFREPIDDIIDPRKVGITASLVRNDRDLCLKRFHPLARIGRDQPLDLPLALVPISFP